MLLGPTLRSRARRVVGRYQPEEIYSTQREAIERQIREGLENAIKGRHVELEGVLIRNVTLPECIQAAINDKLRAEQAALKMKFVIAEAEALGTKELMEAKSAAERGKIVDLAAAEAKRIDGQATDDYVRLVQAHINERMIQWARIEPLQALSTSPKRERHHAGRGGEEPDDARLEVTRAVPESGVRRTAANVPLTVAHR